MHGAGLANTLYMPPHSSVIEIVAEYSMDSRHFPFVGIFPRLSIVAAFHHYTMVLPTGRFTNATDDQCARGSDASLCRLNFDPEYIKSQLAGFMIEKANDSQ
jgi:hypothetical protein